jgi:N-glycosyltransferase
MAYRRFKVAVMRILMTTQPAPSHLRALVPAALALRRRGHELVVALPPMLHPVLISYGLEPIALGGWPDQESATWHPPAAGSPADAAAGMWQMFAGPPVLHAARALIAAGHEWRPDLILRDSAQLAGALAAEALDIPHVSVQSTGTGSAPAIPGTQSLVEALNAHRVALGLPRQATLAALFRHLHANLMPASYDPALAGTPNTRCYRQRNPARPDEVLPVWLAELPEARLLLFASVGTSFNRVPGRVEAFLAAVSELDCSAIVAAGPGQHVGALTTRSPHVRVVDEVPQPLLLECCDLFLTHGGFNSVRESLRLGVPMVIAPVAGDQLGNARRCAELGVAHTFSEHLPDPAALAHACREVLNDSGYHARARAMQRQILALPPLDAFAADVERVVGGVSPVSIAPTPTRGAV